jgi:Phage integrase family
MRAQHQDGRFFPKILLVLGFGVASLLVRIPEASAQAWVPPAGVGSVSAQFQWISNTGHFLSDGSLRRAAASQNASIYMETEYAFTDRFSAAFGVAYVFSRYSAKDRPPPIFPFLPTDQCRCWNRGWQDFGITARYNVLGGGRRSYAITPSISVGLPSNDYAFRGEAVVGRNLKEVTLAIDAGKRLDMISRRLSVQGRYSYAIVEKVLDIRHSHDVLLFPNSFGRPHRHLLRVVKCLALRAGLNCGHCSSTHDKKPVTCATHPVCKRFRLHKFRKTWATKRSRAGMDIVTLAEKLGHSDLDTTRSYVAADDNSSERVRAQVNAADAVLQLVPPARSSVTVKPETKVDVLSSSQA